MTQETTAQEKKERVICKQVRNNRANPTRKGRYFAVDMAKVVFSPSILAYRFRRIFLEEPYDVPKGAIIVANHSSMFDPVAVIFAFLKRRLFFLAAENVMTNKAKQFLMSPICVEINRQESDIEAIREVKALLDDGQCVAMFPQGGIVKTEDVESIKSGAILMALQSNAPIIPAYIAERKNVFKRKEVVIGPPFLCKELCGKKMPSMKDMKMLTEELLNRMKACEERALTEYRGGGLQ